MVNGGEDCVELEKSEEDLGDGTIELGAKGTEIVERRKQRSSIFSAKYCVIKAF